MEIGDDGWMVMGENQLCKDIGEEEDGIYLGSCRGARRKPFPHLGPHFLISDLVGGGGVPDHHSPPSNAIQIPI